MSEVDGGPKPQGNTNEMDGGKKGSKGGRGYPRRRGKGRGWAGKGKSNEDGPSEEWASPDMPPWVGKGGPTPASLEGEWLDSLGHAVTVEPGWRRNGPLTVRLVRGEREQVLSLRCDPMSGVWACGNALLDLAASGPQSLVWVTHDGRRSVWTRCENGEGAAGSAKLPDLLPWLLVPPSHVVDGEVSQEQSGSMGMGMITTSTRRRWASIAEESVDEEDIENLLGNEDMKAKASDAEGSGTSPTTRPSNGGRSISLAADSARVSALLDVRQVLGNDRNAQELLSGLLMDHDLLRRDSEDPMIPAADSPLWERLPEVPRRNALHRLGNFQVTDLSGCMAEAASPDFSEFCCGRHRIPAASTDVQALLRRWMGPNDLPRRASSMAHVLALYRALESPLLPFWQRGSMQLTWDPVERKKANVEYELFASPFNARVSNGRYASRWPHAEGAFGSLGSYPTVVSAIPTSASVGVNPPFSEAYLDHVVGKSLDDLVERFRRVHLTVPVREAPWRAQLQRLQGASFMRQFWDSTSMTERPLAQPVLYWEGGELLPTV